MSHGSGYGNVGGSYRGGDNGYGADGRGGGYGVGGGYGGGHYDNSRSNRGGYNGSGGGYGNNRGHMGGGGSGGGYSAGYGGGGPRKRGRDDEFGDPNYRRRNNDRGDFSAPRRDYRSAPSHVESSPQDLFKELVWKLGSETDFSVSVEYPPIAEAVVSQFHRDPKVVYHSFRIACTEMPHKSLHYAALIALLCRSSASPDTSLLDRVESLTSVPGLPSKPSSESTEEMNAKNGQDGIEGVTVNVGKQIVLDLVEYLQSCLKERRWRSARFLVQFFAHLTRLPQPHSPIVSQSSYTALLNGFVQALNKPGLPSDQEDEIVRIVVEGLLRMRAADESQHIVKDALQSYLSNRIMEMELFKSVEVNDQYEDRVEVLVSSLSAEATLAIELFTDLQSELPSPDFSTDSVIDPISLPAIILPSSTSNNEKVKRDLAPSISSSGLTGEEGVGYEGVRVYLRIFDDDTVPSSYDPSGVALRSMVFDIIDLYEHNRKECAAILLDLPKWVAKRVFRSQKTGEDQEDASNNKGWILEHVIVECILSCLFSLPKPRLPFSYYHALLSELCRLTPQTAAPALGKCVRKLYAGLGSTSDADIRLLDSEGVRRFAEWFSIHLSNFGFMWGWKDWASDMDTDPKHPKRVFVTRTIEQEIRLSYYDRVKGTIPEVMLETGVLADAAPGPVYEYEAPGHKHSATAATFLRLIKAKGSITDVTDELAAFQKALQNEEGLGEQEAEKIKIDMVVQTILFVGSRSFSHFLNVLERYLKVLKTLTPTAESRLDFLHIVSKFWRRNRQFFLIMLDKFLQYRLVGTADVISFIFSNAEETTWSNMDLWSTLVATIRNVETRIVSNQNRVTEILHQMGEKDTSNRLLDEHDEDASSAEALAAKVLLQKVKTELASTVSRVVIKLATLLESASANVASDPWEAWWVEGWFREFCRSNSQHLATMSKSDVPENTTARQIFDSAKNFCSNAEAE